MSRAPTEATDPEGRVVVLDEQSRVHLARRRPWLLGHLETILDVISRPDVHTADPIAGRERFYRRDLDGKRWLRVVVDFEQEPARVVTAVVQDNAPREPSL